MHFIIYVVYEGNFMQYFQGTWTWIQLCYIKPGVDFQPVPSGCSSILRPWRIFDFQLSHYQVYVVIYTCVWKTRKNSDDNFI